MTPDDVRAAAEQLVDFHERFAPLFGKERSEPSSSSPTPTPDSAQPVGTPPGSPPRPSPPLTRRRANYAGGAMRGLAGDRSNERSLRDV